MQKRIRELVRLAGKQTVKGETLEEAVRIAWDKQWIDGLGLAGKTAL